MHAQGARLLAVVEWPHGNDLGDFPISHALRFKRSLGEGFKLAEHEGYADRDGHGAFVVGHHLLVSRTDAARDPSRYQRTRGGSPIRRRVRNRGRWRARHFKAWRGKGRMLAPTRRAVDQRSRYIGRTLSNATAFRIERE